MGSLHGSVRMGMEDAVWNPRRSRGGCPASLDHAGGVVPRFCLSSSRLRKGILSLWCTDTSMGGSPKPWVLAAG